MARASAKLSLIRKRLPKGMQLSPEFPAFVKLVTSEKGPRHDALRVGWSDMPRLMNVNKAAGSALVPFLTLGDGGAVAFWKDGDQQRVVVYDSEGQHAVLALTFHDFVARLGKPTRAFRERVELDCDLDTSKLVPRRAVPKPVPAALNRKLTAWVESHSLSVKTLKSPDADKLRRMLVTMARRMLTDGLSRVYKPRDSYWSVDFRLVKRGGSWQATYRDFGKWYDVPAKYGLLELLPALMPLMKTRKARYELGISKHGNVFADRGNELALEPMPLT